MKPTDKLVPDGDSAHDIVVALHEKVLDLELRTKHFIFFKLIKLFSILLRSQCAILIIISSNDHHGIMLKNDVFLKNWPLR